MSKKIICTVITASYNGMPYLKECVESVQAIRTVPHTSWNFEHIVIDDCSTDTTALWMKKHASPSLRYYRMKKNSGPSISRNYAIARARGEYIFMVDGDDIATERGVVYSIEYLMKHPKSQFTYGDFLRTDENRRYLMNEDYYGWYYKTPMVMLQSIFSGTHYMQHSMVFRASFLKRICGYNPQLRLAEDLELVIRCLLAGELPAYIQVVTHLHRFHDHNLSSGITMKKHLKIVEGLYMLHEKELKKKKIAPPKTKN